jgi:hypothetical protein
MTTVLIINLALAIPVFVAILGLALWSFRSQHGDRPHVLPIRSRRAAVRVAAGRQRARAVSSSSF